MFRSLLSLIFIICKVKGECGHIFGKPLDKCTAVSATSVSPISTKYTCESGSFYKNVYTNALCNGSPDNRINFNDKCELFDNCVCGVAEDCNIIEKRIDNSCDNGEYTLDYYVENQCISNPNVNDTGSFIIYCDDETEDIAYQHYDDFECSCNDNDNYLNYLCEPYKDGVNDNTKECGHFLGYPLNECSYVYSYGYFDDTYTNSYVIRCDSGGWFYQDLYSNNDCSGSPETTTNVTSSCEDSGNVNGDENCYCESSIYCDIIETEIIWDCSSGQKYNQLLSTNVCMHGESETDNYKYTCNDDGLVGSVSYIDTDCQTQSTITTNAPCPNEGYYTDCQYQSGADPENCGHIGGIVFDSCYDLSELFGSPYSFKYTCDSESGNWSSVTYTDNELCDGTPTSEQNVAECFEEDGCFCNNGANCDLAKRMYCDGSDDFMNEYNKYMILDECVLYASNDYYDTYVINKCSVDMDYEPVYYYDSLCTITEEPNAFGCEIETNDYEFVTNCDWYKRCDIDTDTNCNEDGLLSNCGHFGLSPLNLCSYGYSYSGSYAYSFKYSCFLDNDGNYTFHSQQYDTMDCSGDISYEYDFDCDQDTDDCYCGLETNCNIAEFYTCSDTFYQHQLMVTDICSGTDVYSCDDIDGLTAKGCDGTEYCYFSDITYDGCIFTPSPTDQTDQPTTTPITSTTETTSIKTSSSSSSDTPAPTEPIGSGDSDDGFKLFITFNFAFFITIIIIFL